MARIVTVCNASRRPFELREMSYIRWYEMSKALARRGHEVDIATGETDWRDDSPALEMEPRLQRVPIDRVRWDDYDAVKTAFHSGFKAVEAYGGASHPLIISSLGSVVDSRDRDGIYFYGAIREDLFETQKRIHATSRYVAVLNPAARDLWTEAHGPRDGFLLVPGAACADLPPAGENPYREIGKVCLFAGNIYDARSQAEANRVLSAKLNAVGQRIMQAGLRLVFLGIGDTSALDPACVTNAGAVSYDESWRYIQHASVGLVVSAGPFMHNNESTKIYYYLRAGVPVVSESGFPNDHVVGESGLGFVTPAEDMELLAANVLEAGGRNWNGTKAIDYILREHTWDQRAATYDAVLGR